MTNTNELPRVEDFQSNYSEQQIQDAEARNTRAIAMQAYLYNFPAFLSLRQLTEFIQGRQYFVPQECPLGGWFLVREFSTPKTATVSPNVDTLYGASYVLLNEQGPVVLTVPPIPGRYYSIQLTDAYYVDFAVVSPRTFGNDGGNYLIVPQGWNGQVPSNLQAVFVSNTSTVCMVQRIFAHDESEFKTLHALQDAIRLTPLDRWGKTDVKFPMVDLSAYAIPAMRMTRDPLKFFEYMNFYTGKNPPPASDEGLAKLFRTAGVGPGSPLPTDENAQQAITQGAVDAQSIINARVSSGTSRNGWRIPDPQSGLPIQPFLRRAVVQMTQMGIFPLEEAMYFFAYHDGDNALLNGAHCYTLTFKKQELPPLNQYGFWSLTMYNENSLLFNNPLHRYCIRPDNKLAYASDGSLTIYLQADKPEGVPESNWLPSPRTSFNVALRTYQPQEAIVNGSWVPPAIQRVK